MVRLGIPGADPAELPVSEAVGARPAGRGLGRRRARRWRSGAGPSWSVPASAAPRAPAPRCAPSWPGPPCPSVVDADGLFALGTGDEIGRPSSAAGGRRRGVPSCSPPTTGSSPAWPERRPGPTGSPPPRRLARRCRGGGAAEGSDHRGGRARRDRPAGHGRVAPPGHGGHRRRAVGRHRGLRGPGRRAPSRRPPWPPTSTGGPPPSARPRASWPGTWPTSSAAGCRASAR